MISLVIANCTTRCMLIDNGSLDNILFWYTFIKMGVDHGQLRPFPTLLKGFSSDTVQPISAITLPMTFRSRAWTATTMTDFLVVKAPFTYNVILGRPTFNQLKVVTSTYHLKMKFSTASGVGESRGKKATVQECYVQELRKSQSEVHAIASPSARKDILCICSL